MHPLSPLAPLTRRFLALATFVVALLTLALSDGALAQVNTLPKPNIMQDNGTINAKGLSTDPQIATGVFGTTGVVVTESTLTVIASAAQFPLTVLRGAIVDTDASGFLSIRRTGLYRVNIAANCTGATTVTGRLVASISTDGGSSWTDIPGADMKNLFLTGALQQNMAAQGYVTVSSAASVLAAGQVIIAMRGSTSDASDMTCDDGGGIFVERVDQLQPAVYP